MVPSGISCSRSSAPPVMTCGPALCPPVLTPGRDQDRSVDDQPPFFLRRPWVAHDDLVRPPPPLPIFLFTVIHFIGPCGVRRCIGAALPQIHCPWPQFMVALDFSASVCVQQRADDQTRPARFWPSAPPRAIHPLTARTAARLVQPRPERQDRIRSGNRSDPSDHQVRSIDFLPFHSIPFHCFGPFHSISIPFLRSFVFVPASDSWPGVRSGPQ